MDKNKLDEILNKHKIWLTGSPLGKCADLRYADLHGVFLQDADLRYTDLRYADLHGAFLQDADLHGAFLQDADLRYADLHGADLQDADLRYADLQGAFLWGSSVEFPVCPKEGSFIGWKKCKDGKLVKLLILEDAKRSSATTRKCRCSKAKVLKIIDAKGNDMESADSTYCTNFFYHVGETVEVPDFDTNRWNECSTGIHFFMTREEAERY